MLDYQRKAYNKIHESYHDELSKTQPRRITIYRNGDHYFPGRKVSIIPNSYANLQHLLHDLSNTIDLPYGVRRLFTPCNGSEITDIAFLRDGASYVCASFEPFRKLQYSDPNFSCITSNSKEFRQPLQDYHSQHRVNVRRLPAIAVTKLGAVNDSPITSNAPPSTTTATNRLHDNNLLLQSLASPNLNYFQQQKRNYARYNKYSNEPVNSKPRSVIIVKYGHERPHKTITILLNRRTTQTYDQLLSDISESFGYQTQRSEKIKYLFNLKGRRVDGINDFFREDEIFVATTNLTDVPSTDLQEITIEMYNDCQQPTARRNQMKQLIQSTNEQNKSNKRGTNQIDIRKKNNIRDSGFMEDEDGPNNTDNDSGTLKTTIIQKQNVGNSEDPLMSNDIISRKTRKTVKLTSIINYEQQRELERQRLKEEERRKRVLIKKEQAQIVVTPSIPKFEQLAIDSNENSSGKANTPSTGRNTMIIHKSIANNLETPTKVTSSFNEKLLIPRVHIVKKRSATIYPSSTIINEKYEFGKKMGDGNFAIVRRSKCRTTEREFAIKIIDKAKTKGKEYMLDREINIMYSCNHPNIVRLFEDYETPDEIYLVMELIKGGDLFDYISKHRRFDEPTSSTMIKDISEGVLYLHSKKIVHRDIKPENLLVMQKRDKRITIKLTDFGLALHVKDPIKTVCGTPTYVAPEILEETGYGIEVDCWAIGIILYILLCGYPPFRAADHNQEQLFQSIKRGKYSYETDYWHNVSGSAKGLIDQLLVVDRRKRMRTDEILVHPWIITTGQSQKIQNMEEMKTSLRTKYDRKMKEYASENHSNT